jgi:serine/threonine protein kinase
LSGDIENDPQVKITDFGISRAPAEADEAPEPKPKPPQNGVEPETVRLSARPPPSPDLTDPDAGAAPVAAQPTTSKTPQLTRTGAISGTPSYIAPELAKRGAAITPAVDVFSFGVVAYRLFTGSPPHTEAPFLACLDGRQPAPHPPLDVPLLRGRIAGLLDACLSFSKDERPSTDELIRALREALEKTAENVQPANVN